MAPSKSGKAKGSRRKLTVKKQTVKDLPTGKSVRAGFIMRDTVIVRTSR